MLAVCALFCCIFAVNIGLASAVAETVETTGFTTDTWQENQITLKNFGTNKEILLESKSPLEGAYKISMVFSTNGHDNAGWDSQFVLGGKSEGAAGFSDTNAIVLLRCVSQITSDRADVEFLRYQKGVGGAANTVAENKLFDINELGYMTELQIIEFEVVGEDRTVELGEAERGTRVEFEAKKGDILVSYDNIYTSYNLYEPPIRHVIRFQDDSNADFSVTNGYFGFAPYFVGSGSAAYDFNVTSLTMINGDGTVIAENFDGSAQNVNVLGSENYYEYTVQSEDSARGGIVDSYDMRDCHETKMISKQRISAEGLGEEEIVFEASFSMTRKTLENGVAAGWGFMFAMPERDADITTPGVYYLCTDYASVVLAKVNESGQLVAVDASQNVSAVNTYFPGVKIDYTIKAYKDGRLEITVDPISDNPSSMSFTGIDAEGYFGFISDRRNLPQIDAATEARYTRIENLNMFYNAEHIHAYGEWRPVTEGYGVERECECGDIQTIEVTGGATLTLEDEIKVNYKAMLINPADAEVEVDAKVSVYSDANAQNAEAVFDMVYDGQKYYAAQNVRSYAVKEIGNSHWLEIQVTIDGTEVKLPRTEYSPKIYAMNKLSEEGEFDSAKDLALTLLDYSSAAQIYFGYNTSSLANDFVTEQTRTEAQNYRNAAYGLYKQYIPQDLGEEFPYSLGMSLNLDGKVSINGYLTSGEVESAEMAVFANESDVTDKQRAIEIVNMEYNGGRYKGTTEIAKFAAKELGDNVYVVFYVNDGQTVITSPAICYGAEIYAYNMLNKSEASAETKTLCETMLNFASAAQIEFNYNVDDLANAGLMKNQ